MATTSEPSSGYWASPCSITAKRVLLTFLVACFVGLSGLVYFDPAPGPALSEVAREGRRIWHDHNCQSCHQLYGFGGFLGPDLTNAASRVRPERLRRLLVEGSGVMPAFGLTVSEIDAVDAFLTAMNETGQGQAKAALLDTTEDPSRRMMDAIGQMIAESDDAELRDSLNLFITRGCRDCHLPLGGSAVGAAEILDVYARLDRTEIMQVLEHGRPPAMPASGLTPQERDSLYLLLQWLGKNRYTLAKRGGPPLADGATRWVETPWWEYR